MTFEEASLLPNSEKITLATMRAEVFSKVFEVHSGSIYKKNVNYFVDNIKIDGVSLIKVNSVLSIVAGSFFYSIQERKVYLRLLDSSNPLFKKVSIVYKFCFSNAPLILPHDLNSGEEIEWLPLIKSIGSIGQRLDDESTGIVLETSSSISFINTNGFFDEIFDSLVWENKQIDFYWWFPFTKITESKKIFDGVVENKRFSSSEVSFSVKDFVYKLRDIINLPVYSSIDGRLQDSIIGKPKRRIYGKAKNVQCVCLDNVLDGINLTGTGTILAESTTLTFSSLNPYLFLSVGDEIVFNVSGQEITLSIESILSTNSVEVNNPPSLSVVDLPFRNKPKSRYTITNRFWNVSGHRIYSKLLTITEILSTNRFRVDSAENIEIGDFLLVGSSGSSNRGIFVKRIFNNVIVSETAFFPSLVVGDLLVKLSVQKVFLGSQELTYGRDWTIFIDPLNTTIELERLAEFNIAQENSLGVNVNFTNGSRSITTTAVVDFRSILKPNDWIRKNSTNSGENEFYEIYDVKEQEILIRETYSGTTESFPAFIKVINHAKDDSLVTCDTLGFQDGQDWIKSPSNTVKHILLNDAGFDSINESSFSEAHLQFPNALSLIIPESLGGNSPTIRDVITKINNSVFGSLYGESSSDIFYSILNAEKPLSTEILKDDDILSFTCESTNEIYNNIKINYRPFVDVFNGVSSFKTISFNSGAVDNTSGVKSTKDETIYIYDYIDAQTIAERKALFFSTINNKLTIKAKMNLFLKSVNDKVILNFDRLFKRFSIQDRYKIGIITGTNKSATETEITVSDLGGVFSRVQCIAPNDALDYSSASNEDKLKWGYVLDNNTETPDPSSDDYLGMGLIG